MTSVGTEDRWPARSAARARTRAALLEAVEQIALEHGYRGTRLDAVARRAGVTTGAIYSIFGGKRALFIAAFQRPEDVPRLTDLSEPGDPMAEVLAAFGRAWAARAGEPGSAARHTVTLELLLDMRGDAEAERATRDYLDVQLAELARDLRRYARAAGEPLPRPAADLALALVGSLSGLAVARVQAGLASDDLFGYVAASLWAGPERGTR